MALHLPHPHPCVTPDPATSQPEGEASVDQKLTVIKYLNKKYMVLSQISLLETENHLQGLYLWKVKVNKSALEAEGKLSFRFARVHLPGAQILFACILLHDLELKQKCKNKTVWLQAAAEESFVGQP